MTLAIFDLDGTLLNGDSDYTWGQFLVEKGLVDTQVYKEANDKFFKQYQSGTLDIFEYLAFSLAPLTQFSKAELTALHQTFMQEKIQPMMQKKASELLKHHKDQGHFLLMITATNQFVTGPIGEALGMDHIIAPVPEIVNDQYTGRVVGIPSFQAGKVTRLNDWLAETGHSMEGSYFYSDSRNDLPLLELVTHPVAVDADETLTNIAQERGWQHISLRD
ncbi:MULTISPECIES: HAD family hydrolase [Marinomonas]|uniref:HAD family hydrolase n=1 Tax=Marinomonas arctica TaxID=383750 RepID=A0A7H1J4M9_9GAMM|nr:MULTISPECIES: HAD family hydrolase [Marinomonas]MCS7487457.1 phosphoserine phosphatase [Marinomonas sp. BSi20414]QNT05445.1 HAD family hydrolase [Marinomonas arctica]GGN33475.1 haloacid dehalogenase [Marinomonas arctica]